MFNPFILLLGSVAAPYLLRFVFPAPLERGGGANTISRDILSLLRHPRALNGVGLYKKLHPKGGHRGLGSRFLAITEKSRSAVRLVVF